MNKPEWIPEPSDDYTLTDKIAYAEGCHDTAVKLLKYQLEQSRSISSFPPEWRYISDTKLRSMLKEIEEVK